MEAWPAALWSIRLDSYCYFCTELEWEAVPNHFGPKKMLKRYAQRCFLFFSTFALRPQRKHFRRHFKAIIIVKCQYFALGVAKIACQHSPRIIYFFFATPLTKYSIFCKKTSELLILHRFYKHFTIFPLTATCPGNDFGPPPGAQGSPLGSLKGPLGPLKDPFGPLKGPSGLLKDPSGLLRDPLGP